MLVHPESQVPNLPVGHLWTHMTICMPQQSRKPKRTLPLDQSQDLRTKTPGGRKTFSGCIDSAKLLQTESGRTANLLVWVCETSLNRFVPYIYVLPYDSSSYGKYFKIAQHKESKKEWKGIPHSSKDAKHMETNSKSQVPNYKSIAVYW